MSRPRPSRARSLAVFLAAITMASAGAALTGSAGAGASTGPLRAVLPFGCANVANHDSRTLLAAARPALPSQVTCFGTVVGGRRLLADAQSSGPVGYGPTQIRSAYGLDARKGKGRVVAIVTAYNDPKAEQDLATYRSAYGLPACTTANGCFRKLNEHGNRSSLPEQDPGWAEETSLDLDAVSATCPDCHLLLLEANSASTSSLLTALDSAVRLHAVSVSNSYGGREEKSETKNDKHFTHSGVAFVFASGDDGYGVNYPASSRYVTAVGGTTLTSSSNPRGWTEKAWSGSGSGCSKYEKKPSWQHDTGCKHRSVADVAADADPNTGLGIYDTFNDCVHASDCDEELAYENAEGLNGWAQVGGTSLSAPIVAAIYAQTSARAKAASRLYSHTASLNDVTSGSNGSCSGSYLCHARKGYDGPTGLGTPHSTGAF